MPNRKAYYFFFLVKKGHNRQHSSRHRAGRGLLASLWLAGIHLCISTHQTSLRDDAGFIFAFLPIKWPYRDMENS